MPQTAPAKRRRAALPALWRLGDGAPPAGPFIGLLPGAEVPLVALSLPAALKGTAREDVARRQAQDRLGAGLDIRPARLGGAEDWGRVAVADRVMVLRWRAALGAAAPRCRGLMPDYLALPAAPGLWTIEAGREGLVARLGPADGFSAESALGVRMLTLALAEARATGQVPRAVLLTGEAAPGIEPLFDNVPVARSAGALPETLVPELLAHGETALDFARDPRADAAGIEARLRRMLWPAVLVLLGALGWAVAQGQAIRADRAQASATAAETLAAVRRDILPTGPILDLEVQVQRAIERRRAALAPVTAADTPLDVLRRAASALTTAGLQAVTLGVEGLSVEVQLADFRALDALTGALAQAGVGARVARSGIDPAGGVAATLALEAAP